MSRNQDVIIVGAGVIGCSIAYHLGRMGIRSQIIERESIGARASGKAWGVITYPPVLLVAEKTPGSGWALPKGETVPRTCHPLIRPPHPDSAPAVHHTLF